MFEQMTKANRLGSVCSPRDFYRVLKHPMSRLRVLDIHLVSFSGLMNERSALAVSALFLSLIHHAPRLVEFSYKQSCDCTVGLLQATKAWRGYKGIRNESLKRLKVRGFTIELDLLTSGSHKIHLPNIESFTKAACLVTYESSLRDFFKDGPALQQPATVQEDTDEE